MCGMGDARRREWNEITRHERDTTFPHTYLGIPAGITCRARYKSTSFRHFE